MKRSSEATENDEERETDFESVSVMDDIEGGMNDEGYMESIVMSNCKYVQTDSIGTTLIGSMTYMSMHYIEALEKSMLEFAPCSMCTVRECRRLEDSLSSKHQKVRFYIGLPSFAVLISVFNLVSSVYSHTNKFALSKFNCYTHKATSLSVRLDLAYRFGVSQPMISRTFIDGLT